MKIVVAIDSFKGCLTSYEAGMCVKDAILEEMDADVTVAPIADGGEGTVEALMRCMHGEEVPVEVTGPLGEKIDTYYGVLKDRKVAVMEMANVAGITMVHGTSKNPMNTTTYGVGEMILHAAQAGYREFIMGIGGSATNDGGMGMLTALGVKFYNAEGKPAGIFGRDVLRVAKVDISEMNPVLKECHFTIMSDVKNPLCGEMGSSVIFGPQKGGTEKTIPQMDEGLRKYAEIIKAATGKDCSEMEGAGAAGGLGFAFLTFLNTTLKPGISFMLEQIHMEDMLGDADLVITGEGCLDAQTAMGKTPIGVAHLAKKHGAKVIAFAGTLGRGVLDCNRDGIDAFFSICTKPMSIEEAMEKETALHNLKRTVGQVCRLMQLVK